MPGFVEWWCHFFQWESVDAQVAPGKSNLQRLNDYHLTPHQNAGTSSCRRRAMCGRDKADLAKLPGLFQWCLLAGCEALMFSFLQYSVAYEDDWRLFLAICNSVYESPAVQPWSKITWTAPRSTWIFRVDPAMAAAWAMPDMRAMQAMLLVARPNYINCMTTWWLHVKFANASTTSSQTPCNYIKQKYNMHHQ